MQQEKNDDLIFYLQHWFNWIFSAYKVLIYYVRKAINYLTNINITRNKKRYINIWK